MAEMNEQTDTNQTDADWHGTPANDPSRPRPEWDSAIGEAGEWGWWEPDPADEECEVWTRAPKQDAPTTPEAAAKWDAMLAVNENARCVAHKKSGEQCRRLAIKGATVCRVHGGASGHVKRAARARLENAADRMAKELLKIAVSDNMPAYVKLDAIKDALDRGGVSAKTAIEVEVGPAKGFEQVFSGVIGGDRADARAARGITDGSSDDAHAAHRAMMQQDQAARALAVPADDYLDAEVAEVVEVGRPNQPPAIDRTPASIDVADPAQFVRDANAKAASTRPRHA